LILSYLCKALLISSKLTKTTVRSQAKDSKKAKIEQRESDKELSK
jgi:hypothetical protein